MKTTHYNHPDVERRNLRQRHGLDTQLFSDVNDANSILGYILSVQVNTLNLLLENYVGNDEI